MSPPWTANLGYSRCSVIKLVPHPGDLLYIRTALGRMVGKTKAGQRRSDHVEGIGGITAVGTWVGQQRDDLVHFIESAGPAVGNHQGHGVGTFSPFVDEMDVQSAIGRL